MSSDQEGELWLERIPIEILDKICLEFPAPDFNNVAFNLSPKISNKMIGTLRSTLIHRVVNLFSPASIRAAIALVRLSSFYDPARNIPRSPPTVSSAESILDDLDQNNRPVAQILRDVTDIELWDLFWLQHVVDLFTTNVMNLAVADSARVVADVGKEMIEKLVLEGKAGKLATEPLFQSTADWSGLVTGLSDTEVARAERGFLHSELLFLTSLPDRYFLQPNLRFAQRLQKWEFKELLTAQQFYNQTRIRSLQDQAVAHGLMYELQRLYHRKIMRKLYKSVRSKSRNLYEGFSVYEDWICLDCQKDGHGTDVKLFERIDFPNYAWYRYAIDFPFKGLFVESDQQYPNGSMTQDQLQAWVGFTESMTCVQRRRGGWVFWDKARCLFINRKFKMILKPSSQFITLRRGRGGHILRFYTHDNGNLHDAALRHSLHFLYNDYGVDWYYNYDEDSPATPLVNTRRFSRSTYRAPMI